MDLIALALAEDIGTGDVTTAWFTDSSLQTRARIFAKQTLCLSGVETAREVFRRVDPTLSLEAIATEGTILAPESTVMQISGSAHSILTAERVALNFLQRLSGIATLTRRYVQAIEGTEARILDTRKTTPGHRLLEKAAVLAGGGTNHRFGLYDQVLIKDNHLAAGTSLSSLQTAILAARASDPSLRVEIEADTLDQVREFYSLSGIDVILLDNMSLAQLREAVASRPEGVLLEASGGVTLDSIRAIAETGVDFISVGALTHSAPAVDLSLEMR